MSAIKIKEHLDRLQSRYNSLYDRHQDLRKRHNQLRAESEEMRKRCKALIATTQAHRANCMKTKRTATSQTDNEKLIRYDDVTLRMLNCVLYGKH